ncbi:MAG: transcription elongation factor, partial [Methylobacterium sp.]
MSVAFVKEPEGGEAFENLPDRPISPHTNFVTPDGLTQIEAEVARLERELGTLDHADKAEDSRIGRDLRYWLARKNTAQVVEPIDGQTVHFGATVTILREDEADPHKGSISYVAPLAQAITGKSVGDVVEVNGS